MTAKITISLSDELLARLDAEADALDTSRSQLVQESVATYLGKTPEQREADARRERILGAIERMRNFGEGLPINDDRSSLEILRELRDNDDFLRDDE